MAVNLIVAAGGIAILSETPEIVGAERMLTANASPPVAEKILDCVSWWKKHALENGVSLDNNPSPGNKAGGLTAILEKSLGAVSKAGHSEVVAFCDYAARVNSKGLVFMDSPGYDPVSATGQIPSGANVIAFTNGRGSCFGSQPAPCLKLASNSLLFEQMADDMDINCGGVLEGSSSLEQLGDEILKEIVAIASGKKSKSEKLGYGTGEFIPWRYGAILLFEIRVR